MKNRSRRRITAEIASFFGLGLAGLGSREAAACHTYVSPIDGKVGCGPYKRDRDNGVATSTSGTTSTSSSSATNSTSTTTTSSNSSTSSWSGRLSGASHPVLIHLVNYSLSGPFNGLNDARDLMTKMIFIPYGQHAITIGSSRYFDHSASGIEAGAQQVAKMLSNWSRNHRTSLAMFDVEQLRSVNVPSTVGYNPSTDRDLAARYDATARLALRNEAVRYHRTLIGRVRELLRSPVPNAEFGTYNVPRHLNWYHRNNDSIKSSISMTEKSELGSTLLPMLSFNGPQAQFIVNQTMVDSDRQTLIDWHAESIRARRRALGSSARILPTIWPRLFPTGSVSFPNSSVALPAGFMQRFCNALLDAGANGFVCWTPSADRNLSSSDQAAISRSWSEVAAVARSRGFRAVVT